MEDDKKKFESVFGVPATRNTAPQSLPEGEEEEGSSPPYAVKKSLSTGAPTAGTTAEQITAPPVRLGASGSGLPPAPVKLTHIKEAKIQGFKNFADWNQKIRNQIALVRDILHKMLTVFQKKNQRNENRLNFIKAFYNSFMEDIGKTCQSQLEFANKALPSFEAKDQQAMPVFEQGIREMLIGIRANEKKLQISCETRSVESQISRLQDLRAYFEKNIYEVMNKSLSKHQEFYNLIESCSKGFEVFAEVQERAAKEYDSFMAVFNQAMDEKKKKVEKDLFTEAHKFAGSIRYLILVLKSITDDLIKLQPVAARKEDEYLKSFASSLKQFSLFTQEHFGQFMSATLAKSKFIFEVIDQKFSPSPTPNPNSPLLPPLTAAVPPPSLNAHSSKPTLTPCIPGSTAAA